MVANAQLGDKVLVAAEHDDEQKYRNERRVDKREDGDDGVMVVLTQHTHQQRHHFLAELQQQHEHGNDQADEKRGEYPAAGENDRLNGPFQGAR